MHLYVLGFERKCVNVILETHNFMLKCGLLPNNWDVIDTQKEDNNSVLLLHIF